MDCVQLEEGLNKLGFDKPGLNADDRVMPLLSRYIEEIELFNPAYGLVKVKDRGELIVKHILDSLAPAGIFRSLLNGMPTGRQIADAGSGAGLPGIPLAICLRDVEFTLIERMGRRAGFLRDAVAVLGLSNVRVEEADVETIARSSGGRFDAVVSRAFKPLDDALTAKLFAILKQGGVIAAYKGRRQVIEEEMSRLLEHLAGKALGEILWECIPVEVPFLDEERHLVLLRRLPRQ